MNHPNQEEWMSYLYGELPRADKLALAAHLKRCPPCEAQLAQWQATMTNLNAWEHLPVRTAVPAAGRFAGFQPALKWAVAAAIVLGLGFGLGRISSLASGNVETLRTSLRTEFSRQLESARAELAGDFQRQQTNALNQLLAASASAKAETGQLVSELAASVEEKRVLDSEAIAAALQQLDSKWIALHASLRKELETVAVLTEDGFNDTQQKLYQLANVTQPSANK
jgi:anti-sigma factor RsiW